MLSSKMLTMEQERGQPGVLRPGHTTFSSLQSLRSGNGGISHITPTDCGRHPGSHRDSLSSRGNHHIHDVGNLLPLIHLWASQKPTEIQL